MNALLIFPHSTPSIAERFAGGKGHQLYQLKKNGLPVPDFFVVGHHLFTQHLELSQKTADFLATFQSISLSDKEKEAWFEREIEKLEFAPEFLHVFGSAFADFQHKSVSVRSSAADEDGSSHSFAGMLSSFLYQKGLDAVLSSIKRCWASGFSERSLVYRRENKLLSELPRVAVVIQEMIDPDKSGVLFTGDPIKTSNQRMLVNAVYGVGEGLVSGLLEGDTFTLDWESGKLLEQNLVNKNEYLTAGLQGPQKKAVPLNLQDAACLSESELAALVTAGQKIESYTHGAQDIEWAFKDGQLFILQTRAVTTAIPRREGLLFIWDNSNIVESYGGLTLPLTFGFAHYVYHQVYVQFCEVLMVPPKQIKAMNFFLKDMLGLFYGRVYYNLLNWYKLTSILPGYKYNRKFMETMMGTHHSLADEIADRVRPPAYQKTLMAKVRKVFTGGKFLWYHFTIQSFVDNFMRYFYSVYNVYRKTDYSQMDANRIYADYQDLEQKLLWKWHAPIINDFLCMVHFGIFRGLTQKWLSQLGDNFPNELLAGDGKLESALPTKELIAMAGEFVKNPDLTEMLLSTPNELLMECLHQSSHQAAYTRIQDYIDRFGFRCMSEMKLEQKDLSMDSSLFFAFLKNLIHNQQTDLEAYEKREKELRANAEKALTQNLSGIKMLVYQWSLRNARQAVRNRENTRFCRTRIYGVVRKMFFAIGKDFVRLGVLKKSEDVFYLQLNELKGALEATNTVQNLQALVDLRKSEYQLYETQEPDSRLVTRGPVYYKNQHWSPPEMPDLKDFPDADLIGLGCCPGIIEGPVKVIMGPEDDLTLKGEILVTMRTDPGWIPLYPSARALLVERGGLLSHSAIVAREMGLPTIVGIKGLTKTLKTGMRIRMDGTLGTITILD
jgi:phosphohistidine swiveling domain-containing protein